MPTYNIKNSQNFLKDPNLVKRLISQAGINSTDVVLDIGAGKGIITELLANVAKEVMAYELDINLFSLLYTKFKEIPNVTLINKDFLRDNWIYGTYKVFANIPFNHTSAILNKLVFSRNTPIDCYVVVQKEAALRFMGKGEGTLLAMLLQPIYAMKVIHTFIKSDFDPAPSVDTVLFNLRKKTKPDMDESLLPQYRDFLCYCLNQQKPTLWLRTNKLFTKEQFIRLSKNLSFSQDIIAKDVSYAKWIKLFEYYVAGVSAEKKSQIYGAFFEYMATKDKQKKVTRTKIRS